MSDDAIPFDADMPAFWAEALVYGVYTCLFFQSFVIARQRSRQQPATTRVFQHTTVVLYAVATVHVFLGLHRMIQGFIYTEPIDRMLYWYSPSRENTSYYALQSVMSYIGQSLLIYRCFKIYNNNWLIITPSLLLFGTSMGISIFINYLWGIPGAILNYSGLLNALIPLSLVQHICTPSLTVYRLLRQHHQSRQVGIKNSRSRLNLQTVSMIILESTMIYSVVLVAAIILSSLNSNNKQIPINMGTPTLGLCFSLITIRLHNLGRYESQEKSTVFSVDHRFVFNATTTTTTDVDVDESRTQVQFEISGFNRSEDVKIDVHDVHARGSFVGSDS